MLISGFAQEWMRMREVETNRMLLDLHGTFYEVSHTLTGNDDFEGGDFPRIQPVSRHMRCIPDFCSWNGYFVTASNQAGPQTNNQYPDAGQAQSGLLFKALDDVWGWGDLKGTGAWYRGEAVTGGTESEPMLMRNYRNGVLHLANGDASDLSVDVLIYDESNAHKYATITVPAGGYAHHEFPDGFAADWMAVEPAADCADFAA